LRWAGGVGLEKSGRRHPIIGDPRLFLEENKANHMLARFMTG
jgi:hypothetical protein